MPSERHALSILLLFNYLFYALLPLALGLSVDVFDMYKECHNICESANIYILNDRFIMNLYRCLWYTRVYPLTFELDINKLNVIVKSSHLSSICLPDKSALQRGLFVFFSFVF